MSDRGTRGAYRKEDRVQLTPQLQRELIEKAAARYGNCQGLAKHLNIPKSSVHYYLVGRLTIPVSITQAMLEIANDADLTERVREKGIEKNRTWANQFAQSVYRDTLISRLRLPTRQDLENDDQLRRKAAAVVSYVMAEGSIWMQKGEWGEHAVNITLSDREDDLYEHFRLLCNDAFNYDIGTPQRPGNGARAIRGFINSRFVAEWLIENEVPTGYKSAVRMRLPKWVVESDDPKTWISALQPWCDGEGGVIGRRGSKVVNFSLCQSRHSDLDVATLPIQLVKNRSRSFPIGSLGSIDVFGVSALTYLRALSRSEVLEDVQLLLRRLGFRPRLGISQLRYKDDGFWSCIWALRFGKEETLKLVRMGIIIQRDKVSRINTASRQ